MVIVAIKGLLLVQVPPVVGDKVVVLPTQMVGGVAVTIGLATTVKVFVGSDEHPEEVCVQINVVVPGINPVTIPALLTVATRGLVLAQVPPVAGNTKVVVKTQISLSSRLTVGLAVTLTLIESDLQPVAVSVKANFTVPKATPVTIPALVTVAMEMLPLAQVPPVVGLSVVVELIHTSAVPVTETEGLGFTVTGGVVDVHKVTSCVKVKVAVPCATEVTIFPETVATEGLLLTHVPPDAGDNVVVEPIHKELPPVILTTGFAVTSILIVSEHDVVEYIYLYMPLAALVKVTEAVPPPSKDKVAPAGLPV